jgi:Outer membrane efflux protein
MRRLQARGELGGSGRFALGSGPRLGALRRARHLAAGIALVASATALWAQDVPLSLAQALDLAQQQNLDILAQRARMDAEVARAQGVKRTGWPRLSLVSGWSRTNTRSMVFAQKLNAREFTQDDFAIDRLNSRDALSHLTTTLLADVPVDVSGRVKARAEAQSSSGRAADALTDETTQNVRLRVVEAYRRAALALRVVDVAERTLASARAREADVERGSARARPCARTFSGCGPGAGNGRPTSRTAEPMARSLSRCSRALSVRPGNRLRGGAGPDRDPGHRLVPVLLRAPGDPLADPPVTDRHLAWPLGLRRLLHRHLVALGYWVHAGFLLFTAFVGANLFQSAFTNACPAMTAFRRLGVPDAGSPVRR